MYDIFKRKDVSVTMLYRISTILGHDFFREISDELHSQYAETSPYSLAPMAKGE